MTANAGYHAYNTGDVLTAAQVQYNIQNQTVMYFATTGARTTAISAVTVEGMVTYIPANGVEFYNGTAWVSISAAETALTTKGDLLTYSTAETRLPVGNNGETLVADSSASTGLRYQGNYAAGKNKILNSDFGVWQRGTSFSATNLYQYTADQWFANCFGGTTGTVTRQTFTPGTAPVAGYEGQYFAEWSVAGSPSSNSYFFQRVENVQTLAGQTVTFSFWAKAASAKTITVYVDQNYGIGGSATTTTGFSAGQAITTSWVRYSFTATIGSIAGKTIGTASFIAPTISVATAQGSFVIDIWGVQVEAGSVATAFQTATGTIQGELAACQRYYYRRTAVDLFEALSQPFNAYSTTRAYFQVVFPVTMRTQPTVFDYSTTYSLYGISDVVTFTIPTSFYMDTLGTSKDIGFFLAECASGLTQYRSYSLHGSNTSTNGYIGFGAEL